MSLLGIVDNYCFSISHSCSGINHFTSCPLSRPFRPFRLSLLLILLRFLFSFCLHLSTLSFQVPAVSWLILFSALRPCSLLQQFFQCNQLPCQDFSCLIFLIKCLSCLKKHNLPLSVKCGSFLVRGLPAKMLRSL